MTYWRYEIEQGGKGLVIAETINEATEKVIDAYSKHSGDKFTETVFIYKIQQPFCDAPDVIEILDY